ncbi:MAG: methylmalonyl-CoA epimerase [Bryobacteraceae bacterium]
MNKADQPGIEQLERDMHAMLGLSDTPVAMLRSVALEAQGIEQILATLDGFRDRRRRRRPSIASSVVLDHIAIAVRSIDESLKLYRDHLGLAVSLRETVAHENVHVAMLPAGDSRIELLEPTGAETAVGRFLEKRGEGIHHIALRVPDLVAAIANLRKANARLIGEPRTGAGGHHYVFMHPASTGGVLLELIEEERA